MLEKDSSILCAALSIHPTFPGGIPAGTKKPHSELLRGFEYQDLIVNSLVWLWLVVRPGTIGLMDVIWVVSMSMMRKRAWLAIRQERTFLRSAGLAGVSWTAYVTVVAYVPVSIALISVSIALVSVSVPNFIGSFTAALFVAFCFRCRLNAF